MRKRFGVALIDGVDLTILTPDSALKRVTRVAHTFWQYGRVRQLELRNRGNIRRIGVVFNGATNPGAAYKDAHDFALHEFSKEADLAVDAASPDDIRKLEEELLS